MMRATAQAIARLNEEAQERQRVAPGQIVGQLAGGQVAPAAPGVPGVVDPDAFEPALGSPGADGYGLTSTAAGVRSWAATLTDPTTTAGDLVYRGPVSLTRLPVGAAGQFLSIAGGVPAWAAVAWADVAGKPATFAPSAHKSTHATGGSDALSPADIGAATSAHAHAYVTGVTGTAPIVSSGGVAPAISISAATSGAAGSMSAADKAKLDGVAASATANATDAALRDRSTHTGNQAAATISDLREAIDDAVALLLTAGANISLSYDDGAGALSIAVTGIATGYPALSGLSTGAVLRATGSTAAAFGAVDLADSDARTGVLPVANGGTGVASIPQTRAHRNGSNQTVVGTGTITKVQFTTYTGDTFDTTNYRYLPTTAGTYLVICKYLFLNIAANAAIGVYLRKNGTSIDSKLNTSPAVAANHGDLLISTVALNGTSDYLEMAVFQSSGVDKSLSGGSIDTVFTAIWVAP
jgi:hypothetical protein